MSHARSVVAGEAGQPLSIEVYLSANGVCLAVPRGCGLEQADALRVDVGKRSVVALRRGSELPIDLPALSEAHCLALLTAGEVAVGEFAVQGAAGAYSLAVVG